MAELASINLSGDNIEDVARPSILPQMHREDSKFTRHARSGDNFTPTTNMLPADPFADKHFEDRETSVSSDSELFDGSTSQAGRTTHTKPTTILPSTKGKQRQTQSVQSLDGECATHETFDETTGSESDHPSRLSVQLTGAQFTSSSRHRKKYKSDITYHSDTYSRHSGLSEHHCKCCRSRTEDAVSSVVSTAGSTAAATASTMRPHMTRHRSALTALAAAFVVILVASAIGITKTHGENPRTAKRIYLSGILVEAGIASLFSLFSTSPSLVCLLPFCAVTLLGILVQEEIGDLTGSARLGC